MFKENKSKICCASLIGDMRSDASPLLRQSLQTVRGSLSSCTVGITPFKKIKMENDPLVNDTKTGKQRLRTNNPFSI